MATYTTGTGQVIGVHDDHDCRGTYCVIHHPSPHHMREWPTHWRADRHLMERVCPHGIGHPDPDDINFHYMKDGPDPYRRIHGCDGCCFPPQDERESNP